MELYKEGAALLLDEDAALRRAAAAGWAGGTPSAPGGAPCAQAPLDRSAAAHAAGAAPAAAAADLPAAAPPAGGEAAAGAARRWRPVAWDVIDDTCSRAEALRAQGVDVALTCSFIEVGEGSDECGRPHTAPRAIGHPVPLPPPARHPETSV
jgi:hypothetical protein